MTIDAYAPTQVPDPKTLALSRILTALAEDAIFTLAAGGGPQALEPVSKRRGEAYSAILGGHALNSMMNQFDHWIVEMTRVVAPIAAPVWMPMGEVLREKVTLEGGAKGLRGIFSSKPSDKEVQRVKRLGSLAVRVLRATFAADGTEIFWAESGGSGNLIRSCKMGTCGNPRDLATFAITPTKMLVTPKSLLWIDTNGDIVALAR